MGIAVSDLRICLITVLLARYHEVGHTIPPEFANAQPASQDEGLAVGRLLLDVYVCEQPARIRQGLKRVAFMPSYTHTPTPLPRVASA